MKINITSNCVQNFIIKASDTIHSPEQRLFTGLTALMIQPFFDLNNKKLDKDTRVLAASKSLGKIIAGTTSGVIVRSLCMKIGGMLSQPGKIFYPAKNVSPEILAKYMKDYPKAFVKTTLNPDYIKNYSATVGNALAVVVMIGTNFLWDAPVTKRLTNFFYKKITGKDAK